MSRWRPITRWRDEWEKRNKNILKKSGLEYEYVDKDKVICQGYVFNVRTGFWHKKNNGKKLFGQSAIYFLKFLKQHDLYDGEIIYK